MREPKYNYNNNYLQLVRESCYTISRVATRWSMYIIRML